MATYFIRQGAHGAQGPFDEARIAGYIAAGRVRPGMEISPDGQRWMPVEEHRLFASAAPASSAVPPPRVLAPVAPVEAVEAAEEVESPRTRRARRPVRQSTTPVSSDQAAGIGCLGLVVVAAIVYMVSPGGGKVADSSSDRGVVAPTASVPGVFRSHEVRDGLLTREGFDTWLVLTQGGMFEWYEKRSDADEWERRLAGTWSSAKRRYTDSGNEYLGVNLKGESEELSFAFDHGALSMSAWTQGMQRAKGRPFSTVALEKKSDSESRPSPIKLR